MTPYPGSKWCDRHGWCNHTKKQCRGLDRSKSFPSRLKCLKCKSTEHLYRDCPLRQKDVKCDNCHGPHKFDDCPKPFDPDTYFPTRKARIAKYPKREEPDSEAPVAIVGCRFQVHSEDLSADKYLPLLDSIPEYMSLSFISAKEGIRLGYGSEIEAENATAALQEVTKKHVATGLTLQCARVQGPGARTEKSGNALGALGTSVTSSSSSSPVTPWKRDLEALDTKLSGEIISLRTKQEDLSCTVTKIQDVQKQDSSVLRLVSIRMGVTPPDQNNPIEVAMATAGAIPGVSSSSPSPSPSPSHDAMEGIIGSGLKRKTRTDETS